MVTASIGRDLYKTEVTTTGHAFIADEPAAIGGSDLGSTPTEYLLVALASCTVITLRMYADRKKIEAEKISAEVSSEKTGNVTVFHLRLHLEGNITEEQRHRMLQIADSCPVHKTLTQPIEIKSILG